MTEPIAERLGALEARLKMLEERLGVVTPKPAAVAPPAPPVVPSPPRIPGPKPLPVLPPTQAGSASKGRSGGISDVLAVISVLCFVLAAAWLVKLAADAGWFSPARRIASAGALGLGLVAAGLGLREREEGYAAYLPAAGVVVLYLAAYAGQLVYGLYPFGVTLALVAGITALTLGLQLAFPGPAYTLVAMLGCYAVPLLARAMLADPGVLMMFLLAWDLVFVVVALASRQRGLLAVAGYLALGSFSVAVALVPAFAEPMDSLVFQAVQMGIFFASSLVYSGMHRAPMRTEEAWSVLPLLVFFYGLEYSTLHGISPDAAPWAGLLWAGLVLGAYGLMRGYLERGGLEAGPMVTAYAAFIAFHAGYLVLLPRDGASWLALLLLLPTAIFLAKPVGSRHWGVSLALGLLLSIEFFRALLQLGGTPEPWDWTVNLAFAAMLLGATLWLQGKSQRAETSLIVFAAAHVQALAGLARLGQLPQMGPWPPMGLSVVWCVYGLAVLGLAFALRRASLATTSLGVLLLAAAKALLLDQAGAALPLRIMAFLAMGVLLYSAGLFYRRVESWEADA